MDEDMYSFSNKITGQLFTKIVAEQDEYVMKLIEDYVNNNAKEGNIILKTIIPEGKLRHIINLGITEYNRTAHIKELTSDDLLPQEQYIEFLRREMLKLQQENQKLQNRIDIMENVSGLRSVDTEIK